MLYKTLIKDILNKYNIYISVDEIEEKYSEEHRYYHNINHINFLNEKIIELYKENEINKKERDILIISSLFHDIIFIPGKKDNEVKSLNFFKNYIDEENEIFI